MSTDVADTVKTPWLFASLRDYRREWLTRDLVAGLTVWAVLVPESLAYATIAGVSPVIGLRLSPSSPSSSSRHCSPTSPKPPWPPS